MQDDRQAWPDRAPEPRDDEAVGTLEAGEASLVLAPRSRAPLIGAAFLFALVAIAGLITAYAAVKDFAFARASGDWPQTHGVILTPGDDGGEELRYAYHVDGESFEGRRLAFLTRGYIGSPPPRTPGAKVDVYVSPIDPTTAVLVPGGSGRRFAFWLLMSGVAVFVGVAGLTRTMMAIDFPEFDVRPQTPAVPAATRNTPPAL